MDDSQHAATSDRAEDKGEEARWTWRPLLLALLGLATGIGAHLILGEDWDPVGAGELALLAALTIAAGLIGFTIERRLWWASVAFGLVGGVIAGLLVYWNGPVDGWSDAERWRMVALLLAIAVAAPLFQAARDSAAPRFPYAAVHDHAWTNIVLWGACWVFVGLVFALLVLLAALFNLIAIDFLRELMSENWFLRMLAGLAFGAALGLLREHDAVVRLLQRVAATVLAVLAPVLAAGLLLFLGALPFTGLGPLWEATDAATPILLLCAIGALVLANAVIGNAPEHESRLAALRWGATGLALVVLPLAVLAAVATGLRIGQYGFTPERLWAATFVAIACLFGLGYWWSLGRGRLAWAGVARPVNLALAFVVCGVALLLATPLVDFNAISTRDQVARLEAGKVASDKFDWAALAFDFGARGKAALARLAASPNAAIRARATEVAQAKSRWEVDQAGRPVDGAADLARNLRVLPAGASLPERLRDAIGRANPCTGDAKCTLLLAADEAWLFEDGCFSGPADSGHGKTPAEARATFVPHWCSGARAYRLAGGTWRAHQRDMAEARNEAERAAFQAAYKAGRVEVRTVPRRQVFVGGVPVGEPFE